MSTLPNQGGYVPSPQVQAMMQQDMQMQQRQAMQQQALLQFQMAMAPQNSPVINPGMIQGIPQQPQAQQGAPSQQAGPTGIPMVDTLLTQLFARFDSLEAQHKTTDDNLKKVYEALYDENDKNRVEILLTKRFNDGRGNNVQAAPPKPNNEPG